MGQVQRGGAPRWGGIAQPSGLVTVLWCFPLRFGLLDTSSARGRRAMVSTVPWGSKCGSRGSLEIFGGVDPVVVPSGGADQWAHSQNLRDHL